MWSGAAALVVVAAIVIALVGRGGHPRGGGNATVVGGPVSVGGNVGQQLPSFRISAIGGAPVKVPSGRPGVIYFFAGWCSSCVPGAQALDQIARRFGGRVSLLAISPDPTDSLAQIRQFRQVAGDPPYPFAWDNTDAVANRLRVTALETTLVYSARGRIVYRAASFSPSGVAAALRQTGV